MLRRYIKVKVCMITAGEGIEAASMLTEELTVLVLVRELVSSQEQHVLTEVGQAGQVDRVAHVADVDVQGGRGLVRGPVRDQQHLDTVVELQAAVQSLVLL